MIVLLYPVLFKLLYVAENTPLYIIVLYTLESQVCYFMRFYINLSVNLFSERRLERIACVAGGIVVLDSWRRRRKGFSRAAPPPKTTTLRAC